MILKNVFVFRNAPGDEEHHPGVEERRKFVVQFRVQDLVRSFGTLHAFFAPEMVSKCFTFLFNEGSFHKLLVLRKGDFHY